MYLSVLDLYLQDLVVTPEVILVLQTQIEGALLEWHTHTAAETLKGRLTDEEFKVRFYARLFLLGLTCVW